MLPSPYYFFWFKNLLLLPPPTVKLFNFFYDISHSFKKVLFLDYVNGWKICHRLNSNNSFLETFVCLKHDCESFSPQHFWSQGQTVVLKWPIITIAVHTGLFRVKKCEFLNDMVDVSNTFWQAAQLFSNSLIMHAMDIGPNCLLHWRQMCVKP